MRKIKANDTVQILIGRDRGKTGKVLQVLNGGKKVTVEKCNMVKRHQKPDQQYRAGGIVEKEAPIDISNVALMLDGEPVRVGFRTEGSESGKPRKVRVARQSDRALD